MIGRLETVWERNRLASFVHARRSELVASVVDTATGEEAAAAREFVTGLLARLCVELRDDDPSPVDRLTRSTARDIDSSEPGRLAALTCTAIARAYEAEQPDSREAVVYLAARSSELQKRFSSERMHDRVRNQTPSGSIGEVVESLLSALEARDRVASDHSRAVGIWSGRLAKQIGLGSREQDFAALAGTLHDIGKIATPTELLGKPGPLTNQEWEVMHSHAPIGAKMLERIPSLRELAPVVRAHHERFDGQGYPDRLAGTAIPLVARVLAVSDSFIAMLSKRPYRQPISVPNAASELRRCSGTQWDPGIVAALLSIVERAPRRAYAF